MTQKRTAPAPSVSSPDITTVQILRLDVANWHSFVRRTFLFTHRVCVLIGNNGTGKSATLEALSLALSAWTGAIEASGQKQIHSDDVRISRVHDSDPPTLIKNWPVSVRCSASWMGEPLDWLRTGESDSEWKHPQDTVWAAAKKAERQVRSSEPVTLPLIAGYAALRQWADQAIASGDTLAPDSRLAGYANCLSTAADVRQLKLLMKTRTLAALQKGTPSPDLLAIQDAVQKCLRDVDFAVKSGLSGEGAVPGDSNTGEPAVTLVSFSYDVNADDLVIGFSDGRLLPFGLLSDGQRTIVALVADIARRAATLNPHFGRNAAANCPGIVLIDEVETHLHPRWQRSIVNDLRTTFPLMQFVMTTHSPFVVQSCRPGEVFSFDCHVDENPQALSIEDIVEFYMGQEVPQRSQAYQQKGEAAEEYFRLVRMGEDAPREQLAAAEARYRDANEPFTMNPGVNALLKLEAMAQEKHEKTTPNNERHSGGQLEAGQ